MKNKNYFKKYRYDSCLNCMELDSMYKRLRCYPSYCPTCERPLTKQAEIDMTLRIDDILKKNEVEHDD